MARFLRTLVLAAAAGAAALGALAPAASADTDIQVAGDIQVASGDTAIASGDVQVYPGMEIRQAGTACTLGFADPVTRIAYSAGHCRGNGPVTDRNGRFVGLVTASRDNTPDGSVVRTNQVISDYETISLAPGVAINPMLPGGRQLVADPAATLAPGQPICHFGMVTGESCGTVERINNGWFTMDNGVVSQKGDSGGPVYTLADNGKAVIVGLFNSTWGRLPAAVSWQATLAQLQADAGVVNVAARS